MVLEKNVKTQLVSPTAVVLGFLACFPISSATNSALLSSALFLIASVCMGASFVFVSRMKNRGSFAFYALASILSNGTWYITWYLLQQENLPLEFALLAMFGILGGRTLGAQVSAHVESRFDLLASVKEDPLQIEKYLATAKVIWPILVITLTVYTLHFYLNDKAVALSILIVASFAFMQNFFYVQVSRLRERGKNNPVVVIPIVLLSTIAGLSFFASFTYLGSERMPLSLFLPYVIVTVLGSTGGVLLSMRRELAMKVGGDDHLDMHDAQEEIAKPTAVTTYFAAKPARMQKVLLLIGVLWVFFHGAFAQVFGLSLVELEFPIPTDLLGIAGELPRTVIMLALVIVFFTNRVLFSLMSAAANRDHVWYHAGSILLFSMFDFIQGRSILANAAWDIIPIALAAGALAELYGRDISKKIEQKLDARMDKK